MFGNNEQAIKLLKEIKEAIEAERGKFIYVSEQYLKKIENLLKEYPLRYDTHKSIFQYIYEIIVDCQDHVWNELRDRVERLGYEAYLTRQRMPISGQLEPPEETVQKVDLYQDSIGLINKLDEILNELTTDIAKEATQQVNSQYLKDIRDYEASIDGKVATEATLSSLNSKVTQCDTKNIGYGLVSGVNHGQLSVTTSRSQLPDLPAYDFGVLIKADKENDAKVYLGGSTVDATNGFPLDPGDNITVEIDNANRLYAVAGSGTQLIYILAL